MGSGRVLQLAWDVIKQFVEGREPVGKQGSRLIAGWVNKFEAPLQPRHGGESTGPSIRRRGVVEESS